MKLELEQKFNVPIQLRWIKFIPKFKGYWLLISLITRIIPSIGFVNIRLEDTSITIPLDLRDPYEIDLYAKNKQELCCPAVINRLVGNAGIFLDIGANCGWYSRIIHESVPNVKIIALEPCQSAFNFLIKFASPRLFCLPIAASDEDGTRLITKRKFYRQSSGSRFVNANSNYEGCPSYKIDTLLNSMGMTPTFIKIDTEGAELIVLKGMTTILKTVQYVLIEINDDNVCSTFGYKQADIYDLMCSYNYKFKYEISNRDNTITIINENKTSDILFSKHSLPFVIN